MAKRKGPGDGPEAEDFARADEASEPQTENDEPQAQRSEEPAPEPALAPDAPPDKSVNPVPTTPSPDRIG